MNFSILVFIASGICFCVVDAIAKLLVTETNLITVMWARFLGQLIFSIPLAYFLVGRFFWKTNHFRLQIARSSLLACAATLFVAGLYWLPLAEASSITFTAPIWVAILSGPFLGEQVGKKEWLVACIGFCGILFIVRPGSAIFHFAAIFLVLMAFINALFQLSTRKLVKDSIYTTFFYSGIIGTAISTLLLPFAPELPTLSFTQYFLFAIVGLLGGLGQLLVVIAFYEMKPSKLTPLVYLQMIWATALGYLIFNQVPDSISIIGMLLIVGSGLWLIWHHRYGNVAPPFSDT